MATIHHCPLQCSAMQRERERRGLFCELLRRAAELFSRLNRKPFSQPRAEGREKERKKQGLKNKRFIFFSWVAVGIISVRIAGIDLTGWWLLVLERTQNVESSRKLVVYVCVCVCGWMVQDSPSLPPSPSLALLPIADSSSERTSSTHTHTHARTRTQREEEVRRSSLICSSGLFFFSSRQQELLYPRLLTISAFLYIFLFIKAQAASKLLQWHWGRIRKKERRRRRKVWRGTRRGNGLFVHGATRKEELSYVSPDRYPPDAPCVFLSFSLMATALTRLV